MDRFTLLVVGGVAALVTAGIVASVLVRGNDAPPDLSTPSGVVLAYARAEQRGDAQAAWDLLATSTQQRADHDYFVASAGRDSPADESVYLSTDNEHIAGTTASVVLVTTYADTGGFFGSSYSTNATVQLVQDNGSWRISIPTDEELLTPPLPKRTRP